MYVEKYKSTFNVLTVTVMTTVTLKCPKIVCPENQKLVRFFSINRMLPNPLEISHTNNRLLLSEI